MLAKDFFTPARIKQMRVEVKEQGFVADRFLAENPDCPVFGFNLACLYPFPTEVHELYQQLTTQLTELDSGVYVYPIWATHVTIATFINFTQQSPPASDMGELTDLMLVTADQLRNRFDDIEPFDLWIEPPIISRKAAFLPLSDPTDGIARIRQQVRDTLASAPSLQKRLESLGLNIPSIVHSTVMRFKKLPENAQGFLTAFDKIASTFPRTAMRVKEIYITTETKPYMRAGEIVHRFHLRA